MFKSYTLALLVACTSAINLIHDPCAGGVCAPAQHHPGVQTIIDHNPEFAEVVQSIIENHPEFDEDDIAVAVAAIADRYPLTMYLAKTLSDLL